MKKWTHKGIQETRWHCGCRLSNLGMLIVMAEMSLPLYSGNEKEVIMSQNQKTLLLKDRKLVGQRGWNQKGQCYERSVSLENKFLGCVGISLGLGALCSLILSIGLLPKSLFWTLGFNQYWNPRTCPRRCSFLNTKALLAPNARASQL